MALPSWLKERKGVKVAEGRVGAYTIDPDIAYPIVLKALGVEKPDQYHAELAYQCCKMAAQDLLGFGVNLFFSGSDGRKERWAHAKLPLIERDGKKLGADDALGRPSKEAYDKVRSALLSG